MQSVPKKILIIRFSSIGDIVLTTPVIRCLKDQLRDSEIHYLTKKQYQPVLAENPCIDRLWLYESSFAELLPLLRRERFDYIVDLHKNIRSWYVRLNLGVRGASFPKLNLRKWLLVKFGINLLPDLHIVDRYFRAVSRLGICNDGRGLDYVIPPSDQLSMKDLPDHFRKGFFAVVIGGRHFTKIFPDDKVAEVIGQVNKPVVLLGGSEDRARGMAIADSTGNRVWNGCGLYNLNQSASLIGLSDAVLTNDTGLMHVAAALDKPVVSVWGNTVPAFGMVPYRPVGSSTPSVIMEVSGLKCRPCSKLGFDQCPKKHFRCMKDISTAEIVNKLNGLDEEGTKSLTKSGRRV